MRAAGDTITIGITDHAQAELTDIVFVELPEAGRAVKAGDACAVVESVKTASDIYAPVSGEILESNKAAVDEPALANTEPYAKGWFFKNQIEQPGPNWPYLMSPGTVQGADWRVGTLLRQVLAGVDLGLH